LTEQRIPRQKLLSHYLPWRNERLSDKLVLDGN
jgi:hypothetical protein